MAEIHAFAYRNPRFALVLPLEVQLGQRVIPGRSADISVQGLMVQLAEAVLPGSIGRVRLHIERCTVEIEAEVAYAHLCEAGLRFRFATLEERRFVEMLVKLVGKEVTRRQRDRQGLQV